MARFLLGVLLLLGFGQPLWGQRSDFNGDGQTDLNDFFLFADSYGQQEATALQRFDLDGSGTVDFGDFFAFADEMATVQGRSVSCVEPAIEIFGNLTAVEDFDQLPDNNRCIKFLGILRIQDRNVQELHRLANVVEISEIQIIGTNIETIERLPLKNLKRVNRSITIQNNSRLKELPVFPALTTVGYGIFIQDNPVVERIESFSNLTSIGSALYIFNNFKLVDIDLRNVEYIKQDVILKYNPLWKDLSIFKKLNRIDGILFIQAIDSLKTLSGLENLASIGSNLVINFNRTLNDLSALEALHTVGTDLVVHSNHILDNINGIENIDSVGGDILIFGNSELHSLAPLSGISYLGKGITIESNSQLKSLGGLEGFASVNGDLRIYDNDSLVSLEALGSITRIGGDFTIVGNASLESINGFDDLAHLEGFLDISSNFSLKSISGINSLAAIPGYFTLTANPELTQVDGLQSLRSIGGDFDIRNMHPYQDAYDALNYESWFVPGDPAPTPDHIENPLVIALRSLDEITGSLSIQNNFRSLHLETPNLRTLSGSLYLGAGEEHDFGVYNGFPSASYFFTDGNEFFSFSGFENLLEIKGGLYIAENENLSLEGVFQDLRSVGGDLVLANPAPNLGGDVLSELSEVKGNLWIRHTKLSDIGSFANIATVGGSIFIEYNENLKSIDILGSLNRVDGPYLLINNNQTLSSISNMGSIGQNLSTIEISKNPELEEISSEVSETKISATLIIDKNPKLESLDWLTGIKEISGGFILRNSALLNLNYLYDLRLVRGNIIVQNNPNLEEIASLDNLVQVGGSMIIDNNSSLRAVNEFENLLSVGNEIAFSNNPQLPSDIEERLESRLERETVGLDVELADLTEPLVTASASVRRYDTSSSGHSGSYSCELRFCYPWEIDELLDFQTGGASFHLDGSIIVGDCFRETFDNLISVSDRVSIAGTLNVPNLRTVEGDLALWRCAAGDLSNLTTIRGNLTVRNSDLTDLSLLDTLQTLGGDLEITDNPDLPTSTAQAFADRLRANGFAGQITISGNKDG